MIQQLSSQDSREIAASIVVPTLYACIKELLENSLDAGADEIKINFYDSGLTKIQVEDNGCGFDPKFLQEATLGQMGVTNKIKKFEDIQDNVATYGFRGEALSAIISQSNFTIKSKRSEDVLGIQIELNNKGNIIKQEECLQNFQGTTVIVKDLFHNFPIRRQQFQQEIKKQFQNVVQYLIEISIINFKVQMQVFNCVKGKHDLVLSYSKAQTEQQRIEQITSRNELKKYKHFEIRDENSTYLRGFLSQTSKSLLYFFVNNRPANLQNKYKSIIKQYLGAKQNFGYLL